MHFLNYFLAFGLNFHSVEFLKSRIKNLINSNSSTFVFMDYDFIVVFNTSLLSLESPALSHLFLPEVLWFSFKLSF